MALTKLTQSLIDGTLVTSVNGNTGAVTAGIDLQSSVKTANFTAVANEGYLVNTTSSAITVTLPSSPSLGDEVLIIDYAGTFGTNNVTLTSSNNILGSSGDYVIESNDVSVILIYTDATKGWKVKTGANEGTSAIAVPVINVDYLVVAGGGGGGYWQGGGAGAGGLRTSYGSTSGGGSSAESSFAINIGSNYTVTVGAGGAGMTSSGTKNNGSNSVFASITSIGGGGGGAYNGLSPSNAVASGANGGSGGGAWSISNQGQVAGTGTANQGFDGALGGNQTSAYGEGSGGGGGASAAGTQGINGTRPNGGAGLSVSITGSAVDYAGGGGGATTCASPNNTTNGGLGGTGGGGNGGYCSSGNESGGNGTANTGGGGGGGGSTGTPASVKGTAGDGGSGIVILRYPISKTITAGAGLTSSTTVDGSFKVTTFTAGTDTISFS